MITEELRPQSLKDITGNAKALHLIKINFPSEKILLHGNPGTGKTTAAYALGNDFNYVVMEYNASDLRQRDDLEKIRRIVRVKHLRKSLILFDEIDGLKNWGIFNSMLTESQHPIIATCNELIKVPLKTQKFFKVIQLYPPKPHELQPYLNKIKKKRPDLDISGKKISLDYRQTLIAAVCGSDGYVAKDWFGDLRNLFRDRNIEGITTDHWYWIYNNLCRFYKGLDYYKAFNVLQMAVRCNDIEVLRCLPKGKGSELKYPRFYKKLSSAKYKNSKK